MGRLAIANRSHLDEAPEFVNHWTDPICLTAGWTSQAGLVPIWPIGHLQFASAPAALEMPVNAAWILGKRCNLRGDEGHRLGSLLKDTP